MKNFKVGDPVVINKGVHKGYISTVKEVETCSRLSDSFWETGVRSYEQFQWVNLQGLDSWFGEGMVDAI